MREEEVPKSCEVGDGVAGAMGMADHLGYSSWLLLRPVPCTQVIMCSSVVCVCLSLLDSQQLRGKDDASVQVCISSTWHLLVERMNESGVTPKTYPEFIRPLCSTAPSRVQVPVISGLH